MQSGKHTYNSLKIRLMAHNVSILTKHGIYCPILISQNMQEGLKDTYNLVTSNNLVQKYNKKTDR